MADSTTAIFAFTKPEVNVSTGWPTSLNADLDTLDDLIARPKTVFSSPTVGASTTCDLSVARTFVFTVSQATTLAFTNVPSSSFTARVRCIITNGSAFLVTWPASLTWLGGGQPTLRAAGVDEVELVTRDGGTTWYGSTHATAPRVLYQNQALTSTSTSEVSLAAYTLPASALAANGQVVRITVHGNAVTQSAAPRIKFGASYVVNVGGSTVMAAGEVFQITAYVRRTGAAAQLASGSYIRGTTSPYAVIERTTPAETLSGTVVIDVRGFVTAGGTLNVDGVTVEMLAA